MTANSIVYTSVGFVVAADGRCRSEEPASKQERATDCAQKIFSIKNKDKSLAYPVSGFAFTEDGKFEVAGEASAIALALANREFRTSQIYFAEFCRRLRHAFNAAIKDGRIDEFPPNEHLPLVDRNTLCRIFVVGYFKTQPAWVIAKFSHEEKQITFNLDRKSTRLNSSHLG